MKQKPSLVVEQHPSAWKAAFQSQAMKTSFCLALTAPMLEHLCAIADQVQTDRRLYCRQYGIAKPDHAIVTGRALEKRGLVQDGKSRREWRARKANDDGYYTRTEAEIKKSQEDFENHVCEAWELTPAGEALVALLKVAGIFIEQDAAIAKRAREGRGA
jgi:hypothetical protein